jgi:hypothetical protein
VKDHILCDFIYMECLEKRNGESQKPLAVACGQGGNWDERACSVGL